jgi:hypothetical protein
MCRERSALRHFLPFTLIATLLLFAGCSAVPGLSPAPFQEERDLFETESDLVTSKVLEPKNPFLDYLGKRGWDLLDMFSLRLAAGPGIQGHAQVTQLVQAGAGYLGPAEGRTLGHTFSVYKLGFFKREGGLWKERAAELGISLFYYYQIEAEYIAGNKYAWSPTDRGFWDLGASLHLLLLGVAGEIRPDEIWDFCAGIFGYDPMDDDGVPPDPDYLRSVSSE